MIEVSVKLKGLFTSGNTLQGVPKGSLKACQNIVIDEDHLIESRKGLHKLQDNWPVNSHRTLNLLSFDGHLHAVTTNQDYLYWTGTSWLTNDKLDVDGIFDYAESNKNLYILTNSGLVKHQNFDTKTEPAGLPKATNLNVSLTDGTGFLADNSQVSYRLVWFARDVNANLVLGGVSERAIIVNTSGGTRNVNLDWSIPIGIVAGMGYQVYRSETTANDIPTSDNLQLVFEGAVTNDDINDGEISFKDITPAELRGAIIYTSGTQEGLANNNDLIPLAKTMAVFSGTLFLGNLTYQHRSFIDLLGVGSPNGLQLNDTVTLAGVTYTAGSNENTSSNIFKLFSDGTPSQDIQSTAQSLINVVNKHNSNMYGFYLSGLDDISGKCVFERRDVAGSSFTVSVSRPTAWNVKNAASTNDIKENGIAFSKPNQPEHFSLVNTALVGSGKILKLFALREALITFTDKGIYRISGAGNSFSIELLDSSAILLTSATCQILNNEIITLTTQGVTIVNSQGVRIISRDIEEDILKTIKVNKENITSKAFAVTNEIERRYYLFLPKDEDYCEDCYVYNSFTATWTYWPVTVNCGAVHNEQIYLGNALAPNVIESQKGVDKFAFADYFFDIVKIDQGSDFIEILDTPSSVLKVGDVVFQSKDVNYRVTVLDDAQKRVYFNVPHSFTESTLAIHQSIPIKIEFNPIYGGNPAHTKQWIRGHVYYKTGLEGPVKLSFTTDYIKVPYTYNFLGESRVGWGETSWGSFPWGGLDAQEEYFSFRGLRGGQLFMNYEQSFAYSPIQLQGMAFEIRKVPSLRFRRPNENS